jgi:dGTPase
MTIREELERIEDLALASYAMRSRDTRGRRHREPEHPCRTVYQRDRERIIHTAAFRRLKNKTQTFVATEGDHYRTRLTHTLEVAQIGRAVARMLHVNEDLTEAVCLAHDLGHPPFGHPGEEVLDELMSDHGGFNHNDQSLRVVDRLEQRYPAGLRATIEAQIVNHADEFAYSAADLDDGLRAGILTGDLLEGVTLWDQLLEDVNPGPAIGDLDRHVLVRCLIDHLVTDLVDTTRHRLGDRRIGSVAAVRQAPHNVVGPSDKARRNLKELKGFLFNNFYFDRRLRRMAAKARRLLTDMFGAYLEEPKQLPPDVFHQTGIEGLERTVCDYLAGMTDSFALEEHGRLFDPAIHV